MDYPDELRRSPYYLPEHRLFRPRSDAVMQLRIAEAEQGLPDSLRRLTHHPDSEGLPINGGPNASDVVGTCVDPTLRPGPTADYLHTKEGFAADAMALLNDILHDLPDGIFARVNAQDPLYRYDEGLRRLYSPPRRVRERRFGCSVHPEKRFQSQKDLDRHLGSKAHPESMVQLRCARCPTLITANFENYKRHLINQHKLSREEASGLAAALR